MMILFKVVFLRHVHSTVAWGDPVFHSTISTVAIIDPLQVGLLLERGAKAPVAEMGERVWGLGGIGG